MRLNLKLVHSKVKANGLFYFSYLFGRKGHRGGDHLGATKSCKKRRDSILRVKKEECRKIGVSDSVGSKDFIVEQHGNLWEEGC